MQSKTTKQLNLAKDMLEIASKLIGLLEKSKSEIFDRDHLNLHIQELTEKAQALKRLKTIQPGQHTLCLYKKRTEKLKKYCGMICELYNHKIFEVIK